MPYADPARQKQYWRDRYLKKKSAKPPKVLRSKYRWKNNGENSGVPEHTVIVERVIGIKLPEGAEVHHVDGDGQNNANGNLVVCPSHAYHMLLHKRERALNACGHPDWLKCLHCKQWDDPIAMKLETPKDQTSPRGWHAVCANKKRRDRRAAKRV